MTTSTQDIYIKPEDIWAKIRLKQHPVDVSPPSVAKIGHGFDYGEKPSHSTFNWIMYKVTANANAQQQEGILKWHSEVNYELGAIVQYKPAGAPANELPVVYQSIVANNKNNTPTDPTKWKIGIEDMSNTLKKDGNNPQNDPSGGQMSGDFIVDGKARFIVLA